MKKFGILLISAWVTCWSAFASPIHSYREFADALHAGERFVFVLDLKQSSGNPLMPTGYFVPNALLLVPETATGAERIATSHLQFTDHLGTPAYEYIKYIFFADERVTIQATIYDPQNFQPIGTGHTMQFTLGQGIEIYTQ